MRRLSRPVRRRRARQFTVLFFSTLALAPALAQPAASEPAAANSAQDANPKSKIQNPKSPPELSGPLHRIHLPGNPYILSAAFSSDGETLYVLINDQAINIWEIVVYYWPEIGGGLTALVGIVFLFALRRVLRTPRLVGEPHCRRCNYCLKAAVSDRCPECGATTNRPIKGRSTRRRLLPFAIPAATLVIAYAIPWALWLPRSGSFATWQNWWCYGLEAAALKKGIGLAPWKHPVDRVLAFDLVSGTIRSTFFTRRDSRYAWCPIIATPDGAGLILTIDDDDSLALVSARSGRVLCSLHHDIPLHRRVSRWTHIAGFERDRPVVYVVAHDEPHSKTRLVRWNYKSGESAIILETDSDLVAFKNGQEPWTRRFQLVSSDPSVFLERGSGMEYNARESYIVRSASNPEKILTSFELPRGPGSNLVFTTDGETLFRSYIRSMRGFETLTGATSASPELPPGFVMTYQRNELADFGWTVLPAEFTGVMPGRNLLLSLLSFRRYRGFLLADLDQRRWIGAFPQPDDSIGTRTVLSPDRRWFAAIVTLNNNNSSPKGPFAEELLIYDLRPLSRDSGRPPP